MTILRRHAARRRPCRRMSEQAAEPTQRCLQEGVGQPEEAVRQGNIPGLGFVSIASIVRPRQFAGCRLDLDKSFGARVSGAELGRALAIFVTGLSTPARLDGQQMSAY